MSSRRRAGADARRRTGVERGHGGDAVAQLEALYASLARSDLPGAVRQLLRASRRRLDASTLERARIAAAGVDLDAPTADDVCPALATAIVASGRCTVHAVRPMVCRLWGTAASMPCPHGCVPDGGVLDDAAAMQVLTASLEIGGHRDTGLRELLAACAADPAAAAMLSARMRGDRAVEPALAARLLHLRREGAHRG